MFVDSPRSCSRALKSDLYKIIKNLKDLEKSKSRERVIKLHFSEVDHLKVIALLGHIEQVIEKIVLEDINTDLVSEVKALVNHFKRFAAVVRNNCLTSSKPLDKGHIARILSRITSVFKKIVDADVKLIIDCDEWDKLRQVAISIWGNNINLRFKCRLCQS